MTMTLDEVKSLYKGAVAEADVEREKLERMRKEFSAQCEKTEVAERVAANLKERLTEMLLEQEGLS